MNHWTKKADARKKAQAGDIVARFGQELRRQADAMLTKAIFDKKLADIQKDIAALEKEMDAALLD